MIELCVNLSSRYTSHKISELVALSFISYEIDAITIWGPSKKNLIKHVEIQALLLFSSTKLFLPISEFSDATSSSSLSTSSEGYKGYPSVIREESCDDNLLMQTVYVVYIFSIMLKP